MVSTKLGAVYGRGLALVGRAAPLAIVVSVAYAGLWYFGGLAGMALLERLAARGPDALDVARTLAFGLFGLLSLYTVLQVLRRRRVTRASWLPSLLALPTFGWGLVLTLWPQNQGMDYGPLVAAVHWLAWGLAFASIVGATLSAAWVRAFYSLRETGGFSLPGVLGEAFRRTPDVAGPVGAREHAVTLGIQVIVPGIHYALMFAFAGHAAVLNPERPALALSSRLARGIRGALFRAYLVAVLLSFGFLFGVGGAVKGIDSVVPVVITNDPTPLGAPVAVAWAVFSTLVWGVVTAGLLDVYLERLGLADAADARRDAEKRRGSPA